MARSAVIDFHQVEKTNHHHRKGGRAPIPSPFFFPTHTCIRPLSMCGRSMLRPISARSERFTATLEFSFVPATPQLIYRSLGGTLAASNRHQLSLFNFSTRLHQSRPRAGSLYASLGRHLRRRKKFSFPRQRLPLPRAALHAGRRADGRLSPQSFPQREK